MIAECVDSTPKDAAEALHDLGFPIVLCKGQSPLSTDWRTREYTLEAIDNEFRHFPDLNVGVVLGPRYGLIEIVTVGDERNTPHRDFYDLMEGVIPETPTFESRCACHRIFGWDKRFDSFDKSELLFKSVVVRIGVGGSGAFALVPPSVIDGVRGVWRQTIDDYDGGFARLSQCAVGRIIDADKSEFDITD